MADGSRDREYDLQGPGLAEIAPDFPDLVFPQGHDDPSWESRNDNRVICLSSGRSLLFKSAKDAASCVILPRPGSRESISDEFLTVDARDCTKETRFIFDLSRWDRSSILHTDPTLTVSMRTEVMACEPDAVHAIQWIRLLTRHGKTEQKHLALIDKKVRLRERPGLQSWTFDVPPAVESAGALLLAFQLAPRSKPVAFGTVRLRMNALRSESGQIAAIDADGVRGWVNADGDPPAASLELRLETGLAAVIDLSEAFVRPAGPPSPTTAFSIPCAEVLRHLEATDPADLGELSLGLRSGGVLTAFRRARVAVSEGKLGVGARRAGAAGQRPCLTLQSTDTSSADAMAEADGHHIFKQLNDGGDRRLAKETLAILASRHTDGKLYIVHEAIRQSANPAAALAAYAELYFAKTMMAMNAAETAFQTMQRLFASEYWLAEFDGNEQHVARLQFARAAFYSGRKELAAQIVWQAMTDQPLDWHCYFQLGQILTESSPQDSYMYFKVVDTLEPNLPDRERQALVERLLDRGEIEDALLKTLRAMREAEGPAEYLLSLANIEIISWRSKTWANYVNRFFSTFNLQEPIGVSSNISVHLLKTLTLNDHTIRSNTPQSKIVTIVMACRDAEDTIEVAAKSVLAQFYQNIRLVVVDDNSSDSTAEIIKELSRYDHRLVLLKNEKNMGSYWSRNRAIHEFDSDFYTIHDADDWMHPSRISEHVAFMDGHPALICSQSMWLRMDRSGRAVIQRGRAFMHENPASIFLPKMVFDEVGYFDSVRAGADSEYLWRLRHHYGAESVAKIHRPLGIGLHHNGSITQSGIYAFDVNRYSPIRMQYAESWVKWHIDTLRQKQSLHVPLAADERPFAAPPEMLP